MPSIELSTEERKTRELFAALEINDENVLIGGVFKAKYAAALTADDVSNIAAALFSRQKQDLSAGLSRLVKAKVLRSRAHRGDRIYEVNY